MVVPHGADVPERCVKCNAPAELERPRAYAWHHPGWYLFLLINPLIYVLVGLIARTRSRVPVGLCDEHVRKRGMARMVPGGRW